MTRLVALGRLVLSARGLGLASAVMMMMFALGVPSLAVGAPGGEFAVFAKCPLGTPELDGCLAMRVESGGVTVGKLKVPVVEPMMLQGGFSEIETGVLTFVG